MLAAALRPLLQVGPPAIVIKAIEEGRLVMN